MTDKTTFELEGKKYYCLRPTQSNAMRAQHVSSIVYANAFRNGVMTMFEAEKIAAERGLLGDEYEKKIADLTSRQSAIQMSLFDPTITDEERGSLKVQLRAINAEYGECLTLKESLLEHTCEGIARSEYLAYLVTCCTFEENGQHVWGIVANPKTKQTEPDYEKFLESRGTDLAAQALMHIMAFEQNLDMETVNKFANGNTDVIDYICNIADDVVTSARESAVEADPVENIVEEALEDNLVELPSTPVATDATELKEVAPDDHVQA